MRIAILTKEFPPYIYGGAGVHVEYLTDELVKLNHDRHEIHVLCFGDQKEVGPHREITGIGPLAASAPGHAENHVFLDMLFRNAALVGTLEKADLIHCHTWYTQLAGCLVRQILDAPLVLTTHSLEPHRPWKKDQLGSAYRASTWIEKTAYQNADGIIAVSKSMQTDVQTLYGVPAEKIGIIPNGIDTGQYRPQTAPEVIKSYGIDPSKPYVLMVSRLTRQKGVPHFIELRRHLPAEIQMVICASVPDTQAFLQQVTQQVTRVIAESGKPIIWVRDTVPRPDLVALYSHAALFVCPSIYEPFGIINLEAMACHTPVVASAVGGIPEVVMDGETGRLVSFEPVGPDNAEPRDPQRFARDLADGILALIARPNLRRTLGLQARRRVEDYFSWRAVAERTMAFYQRTLETHQQAGR